MKRMLINATQPEELRVALVDGQRLYDLDIEVPGKEQKKANIYKGRISRVEPSLEACFIDYGAERHGFLPLKEISPSYFDAGKTRGNIRELVREGQEVIVQIEKEERGQKGAALTTFITLAGCYVVLMPNNPRAGGISRRIEGDDRNEIRETLQTMNVPDGMGVIIRTAGVGRSEEELKRDLENLNNRWLAIQNEAAKRPGLFLIYEENDVFIRAVRDYLRADVGEIIVDTEEAYGKVRSHIALERPDFLTRVKLYKDDIPLFNRYQVESQIESAYTREVRLPSGGSIVIDRTEAMVCIDVNSSKATKGGDIEETALQTNVEAAQEVARQLRLRDLGGLIVIDFIDMTPVKNQRTVEDALRDSVALDRARIQLGRLSRFGLMEMSRQRLRPALAESTTELCPRCHGVGNIRNVESMSLSVLRIIEEEAMKDSTSTVHAILPVEAATYLLNEKRKDITDVEKRHSVHVVIVPNPHMDTPNYEVRRLRNAEGGDPISYTLAERKVEEEVVEVVQPKQRAEQAAIQYLQTVATTPAPVEAAPVAAPVKARAESAPVAKTTAKPGLFARLFGFLAGAEETPKAEEKPAVTETRNRNERSRNDRNSRNRDDRSRSGGRERSNRDTGNRDSSNRDSSSRDNSNREPRSDNRNNAERTPANAEARSSNDTRRTSTPKTETRAPREDRNEARPERTPRPPREDRSSSNREERGNDARDELKQAREERGPRQSRSERGSHRQTAGNKTEAVVNLTPVVDTVEVRAEIKPEMKPEVRSVEIPTNSMPSVQNSLPLNDQSTLESEVTAAVQVTANNDDMAADSQNGNRDRNERGDRRRRLPRQLGGHRRRFERDEQAPGESSESGDNPSSEGNVIAATDVNTGETGTNSNEVAEKPRAPAVAEVISSPAPVAPAEVPAVPAVTATEPVASVEPPKPAVRRASYAASAPAAKPRAIEPLPKSEVSEEEALKNVAALLASLIEPSQNQNTVLHRSPGAISSSPMAKPRPVVVSAAPTSAPSKAPEISSAPAEAAPVVQVAQATASPAPEAHSAPDSAAETKPE